MSGFRFSLARVLAWRETQLSLAEGDLARSHQELRRIEAALLDLSTREAEEAERLQFSMSLRGSDLASIAAARNWVLQERKRLEASIAECRHSIEVKTAVLMEARRKVKLLERLKERREEAWTQEQNRVLEELAAESAVGSWRRGADSNHPA